MLLKLRNTGGLLALDTLDDLVNPFHGTVQARPQWGEEEQDPEHFAKADLCFPSGEDLPLCWRDEHYRDKEMARHSPGHQNRAG